MEVQPTRSKSLWRAIGTVGQDVHKSSIFSVGEQISHRDARTLTPVSSDVNHIEALRNFAKRFFNYPICNAQKSLSISESSLNKLKSMQVTIGTFCVKGS